MWIHTLYYSATSFVNPQIKQEHEIQQHNKVFGSEPEKKKRKSQPGPRSIYDSGSHDLRS